MINYIKGDITMAETFAIVNPVNTLGISGAGLAKTMKEVFPNNYNAYYRACVNDKCKIGKLFLYNDFVHHNINDVFNPEINRLVTIINFPTKEHYRNPSKIEYIKAGLEDLIKVIKCYEFESIAIPKLGCGLGGLNWEEVKILIENYLKNLDCNIFIYE